MDGSVVSLVLNLIPPIAGLIAGACLQYLASRAADNRRNIAALQTAAYVDYLRCVSESAYLTHKSPLHIPDVLQRAADAKTRICVYGTRSVIRALSEFERGGARTSTPEGQQRFLTLCRAMRVKGYWGKSDASFSDLSAILFGATPPKSEA